MTQPAVDDDLVVNAERFIALLDDAQQQAAEAVTAETGPALVSGGICCLHLEATSGRRDPENAADFVASLRPGDAEADELQLSVADVDGIADVRDHLAAAVRAAEELPDAEDVAEQARQTVEHELDGLNADTDADTDAEPGAVERAILLVSVYRRQVFHLAVLALLAEEANTQVGRDPADAVPDTTE